MEATVPPEMVKLIAPSLKPLHVTLVITSDAAIAVGSVIVVESVSVHAFASVTVTEYTPATTLFIVSVIEPFDHK